MVFRRCAQTLLKLFCLSIAVMGSTAQAQSADPLSIVVKDFSSVAAYVVALKNGEYIVDLDESKGIHSGDLLAVLGRGDPIIHPITGKTIGHLDSIKAVLKVTRMASGFSFARLIEDISPIAVGDKVRRFGGLRADFWDLTGNGKPFWQQLQNQLPDIVWGEFQVVDQQDSQWMKKLTAHSHASLHFVLTAQSLKVFDSETNPLHEYALTVEKNSGDNFQSFTDHQRRGLEKDDASVFRSASAGAMASGGYAFEPSIDFSAAVPVDEVKGDIVMADFVGHDGVVLMAATDGSSIDVYEVSDAIRSVAKADIGVQKQILFLKWWCPAGVQSIYLSVSAWSGRRPLAAIFVLNGNRLETIHQRPDCMLGTFDLDGDHIPETLVAQQFDPESFFGYRFHRLSVNGDTVDVIASDLKLPLAFSVSGSQFADLTNDGNNEAVVVRNGVLTIYDEVEQLYASSKQMGGSLSVLTYRKDPSFKDFSLGTTFFEIPPLAFNIDDDNQPEVLAISSDRSMVSAPGAYTNVQNIRFVCFKYHEGRFIQKILTQPFDTPVQGLGLVGDQIYFLVTDSKTGSRHPGLGRVFRLQTTTGDPRAHRKERS